MLWGQGGLGVGSFEFPRPGIFLIHANSCVLPPRVLESLLVSLVTTVVVFVASMVLGECRQVTSAAQVGNDSIPLQVTPCAPAALVLRPQRRSIENVRRASVESQ